MLLSVKKTKKRFKLTPFTPYEQDIQKSILTNLEYDRRVAWAGRFNSGAAMLPTGRGGCGRMPVKFNNVDGCSDILGQMVSGLFLAVEVKRPPWTKPKVSKDDDHEQDQLDFLVKVCRNGGIGFFATSVEMVVSGINRRLSRLSSGLPPLHPLSEVNPDFTEATC